MSRKICIFAVALLALAVALTPLASAQVHYVGVGSSAMYKGISLAAYNDLVIGKNLSAAAPAGHCPAGHVCAPKHWTTTTTAFCKDTRTNSSAQSPANQNGTLAIEWVEDTTAGVALDAWAYLNVDSTVGLRCFLARPATSLVVTAAAGTAGANNISHSLFADNSVDQNYDAAIQTLLNEPAGTPFTAGMTDIRAEDGALATQRILGSGHGSNPNPDGAVYNCSVSDSSDTVPTPLDPYGAPCWYIYSFALGYYQFSGFPYDPGNTGAQAGIGSNILSGEIGSTSATQPVLFGLPGLTDPISGAAVPGTIQTFPVGEAPIIFVTNRTNIATGLGQPIGNFTALANGNCYGPGATAPCYSNTGQPAGYTSDGSYYARNVWDQNPWPMVANVYPSLTGGNGNGVCPDGLSDCHVTRRPLGNLFANGDCEGDNSSFTWPLSPAVSGGLRATIPNHAIFPITVFLREPLSGTYNTTEFTEIRRMGTPGGSMGSAGFGGFSLPGSPWVAGDTFERVPYVSNESYVDPVANEALNQQCQNDFGEAPVGPNPNNEGFRIRGIGTGEVINGHAALINGTEGVLNTPDSIAYTFFSFGNVSNLATSGAFPSRKFGYLMIDATDPLFDNYENAIPGSGGATAVVTTANGANVEGEPICEGGGAPVAGSCPFSLPYPTHQEPGQPAGNAAYGNAATPLSWGELPACGGAGQPLCQANTIWHTTVAADASAACPVGVPCTYPHIRDGSYPAWSELRMLCDTALASCPVATDPLGAEALIQNLQSDVHNSAAFGIPDLLPFNDGAAVAGFPAPYGDVSFIRDHYQYAATNDTYLHGNFTPFDPCANTTSHQSNIVVTYGGPGTFCAANTPVNGPPTAECGGDAGGIIRAAVAANYVPYPAAVAPGCASVGTIGDLQ